MFWIFSPFILKNKIWFQFSKDQIYIVSQNAKEKKEKKEKAKWFYTAALITSNSL